MQNILFGNPKRRSILTVLCVKESEDNIKMQFQEKDVIRQVGKNASPPCANKDLTLPNPNMTTDMLYHTPL